MLSPEPPQPLVVILGPTAVGKTEIALQLAERLGGEIVSVDSRLFYRGMDIGTAKPTIVEQQRVPHHLIDVVDPDEEWSLAVFQQAARKAIAEIHQRQRIPFLVGGTGQYVRAVIEEWKLPPQPPDRKLRQALEGWVEEVGADGLHTRLRVIDPEAASRIDARNIRRTIRALEVIFHTGQLFSIQRQKLASPYQLILLGLRRPRPELFARIDARIDAMIQAGWIDEVSRLLAHGYSPDLPSLSAIGYREIIATMHGQISLEEAIVQIKRATRQYVRRQANWFKENDPNILWFEVGPNTTLEMEREIRSRLKVE